MSLHVLSDNSSASSNVSASPTPGPVFRNSASKTKSNSQSRSVSSTTKRNVLDIVRAHGYEPAYRVAKSLQGFVIEVKKGDVSYITKIVEKKLAKQGITMHGSTRLSIQEDIRKEAKILKYLSTLSPPPSLAKFVDFYDNDDYYFLVQEHAGTSLFEFVKRCHEWIDSGLLDLKLWKQFCKRAMRQMVEIVAWMHNEMNCCHLDISLENFAIDRVDMTLNKELGKIEGLTLDFQIRLIDFGLAEVFVKQNPRTQRVDFLSDKHVGKLSYEAPEVYAKKGSFDARSADCFSLGVSFFMMIVGSAPFRKSCSSDAMFNVVMKGMTASLLKHWKKTDHVDGLILDLFSKVLTVEKSRINIRQIAHHPCLV